MADKIEPGDLCVVIGEDPGFEENLGVFLTVTRSCCAGMWHFEKASKPVLIRITEIFGIRIVIHTTASEGVAGPCCAYDQRYLKPIKGQPIKKEIAIEHQLPSTPILIEA